MRPLLPSPRTAGLDPRSPAGGNRLFNLDWRRFFREIWEAAGWSPSVPVYEQLYLPHSALVTTASLATIDGQIQAPEAPNGVDTDFRWAFRLPSSYKNGSDLVPFVDWVQLGTDTGSPLWRLYFASAAPGGSLSASSSSTFGEMPGVDDTTARTQLETIDGTGRAKGDVLVGTLRRDNFDFTDGSLAVLGFGLIYQREGVGQEVRFP